MKRALAISLSFLLLSTFTGVSSSLSATAAQVTPKSSAKPTTKPAPKPVAKSATKPVLPQSKTTGIRKPAVTTDDQGGEVRGNRFANLTATQKSCLSKNGFTVPAPGAANAPRPSFSPNPNRTPGAGGFGNPAMNKAFAACKIALPTRGAGGFGGGNFDPKKFQAFQTCMTTAGISSTGGFGQYDQSDPDTALALVKCQKSSGFTMPTRGAPGSAPGTNG